jgi:AI-2 transport protein TqsA
MNAPMNPTVKHGGLVRGVVLAAGVVVLIAGMRAAEPIIIPFIVSVFIAVIGAPPMLWLQRKGVPAVFAVMMVVGGLLLVAVGIGALVGTSLNDFSAAMPTYQERLREESAKVIGLLQGQGFEISQQAIFDVVDPGAAMRLVTSVLRGLGGVLTNAFLITITVIFILLEASSFPAKVHAALGNPQFYAAHFSTFTDNLKRYLVIKTMVSLVTGATVATWVWILGVDFPLLWGLVAFLLNYVPSLGSIIAALPPVTLAFIQFGVGRALLVAIGYVVTNIVLGQFVEPRFQGRGLGLSTLVVFLSLVFWGWVWGPVGMLLSVPLTMSLKLALSSNKETRWLAVLLGSEASVENGIPPKQEAEA